jgi:hypothetical protein
MEFLGSFIKYYCRKSVDMNVKISIKSRRLRAGEITHPGLSEQDE